MSSARRFPSFLSAPVNFPDALGGTPLRAIGRPLSACPLISSCSGVD